MFCKRFAALLLCMMLLFTAAMADFAGADSAVLQLKSLEAFTKAADGKATKIIIPSEIQGLAGSLSALSEVVKNTEA